MAIKIELKSTIIPVEIGELKFQIDVSDVNMDVIDEKVNAFLKEVDAFKKDLTDESAPAKKLEEALNALLGENAYAKLYEQLKRVDLIVELFDRLMIELVKNLFNI